MLLPKSNFTGFNLHALTSSLGLNPLVPQKPHKQYIGIKNLVCVKFLANQFEFSPHNYSVFKENRRIKYVFGNGTITFEINEQMW